jgi:hypothetical protein
MKKQHILIGIIGLLLINIAYATLNGDGSCIIGTQCDYAITIFDDNNTQTIDAYCYGTTYSPNGTILSNQTQLIPSNDTLDFHLIFTPTELGLYQTIVYCSGNKTSPVYGDLSFISAIPENETPAYNISASINSIAEDYHNQTSFFGDLANVAIRTAMWLGIPLGDEINLQTTIEGLPYQSSQIFFNTKITDEYNKILNNATCVITDNQTGNTAMSFNSITKTYQATLVPNSTGILNWSINCTYGAEFGYQEGWINISTPPASVNESITPFSCTGIIESNLNVFISEWLPIGATQKLYAYYTSPVLNNTAITTPNTQLQLWMDNQSYNMTWDAVTQSWQILLYSGVNEDTNINIVAYDPMYKCQNYTQTVKFREFTDACIAVWEDKNMTNRYENKFGYVLANWQPRNVLGQKFNKDKSLIMTQKVLYPVAIFSTWGEKTFGLEYTKAYQYYRKSFHAEYNEGIACLSLPKDEVFNFVFVSGEWIFSDVIYDTPMWTKQDAAFNLGTSYLLEEPTTYNFVATPYEQNPGGYIWRWILIVLFTIMIVGLPAIAYIGTKDPTVAIKMFVALLAALPTIYYVIKWLFLT